VDAVPCLGDWAINANEQVLFRVGPGAFENRGWLGTYLLFVTAHRKVLRLVYPYRLQKLASSEARALPAPAKIPRLKTRAAAQTGHHFHQHIRIMERIAVTASHNITHGRQMREDFAVASLHFANDARM
jgi:hypothetical protein